MEEDEGVKPRLVAGRAERAQLSVGAMEARDDVLESCEMDVPTERRDSCLNDTAMVCRRKYVSLLAGGIRLD